MQVTVTYLGMPVVALDAGVARTPAGAVAIGFGIRLGGYEAYSAGGPGAIEALELHDAQGALIPTTRLRVWPTPLGQRAIVFAHVRNALAGVLARLEPGFRAGTGAVRPRAESGPPAQPRRRGPTAGPSAPVNSRDHR